MIKDTSAQDEVIQKEVSRFKGWFKPAVIASIVLILAGFSLSGLQRWASAERSVSLERLRLAEVTQGYFVRDISVQGKVVAAVSPTLYSPASGIITLIVNAGERVETGQVLAKVDSPELVNQFRQEQSGLQKLENELERQLIDTKKNRLKSQQTVDLAKVKLDAADREKRRADASIGSNAISQFDYEKSKDDLNTARLQYQHAKQDAGLEKESLEFEQKTRQLDLERQKLQVENLERQVEELTIKSPVAGIVGNLNIDQKANVAANQALLTVVDLSEFEIEIKVPESYADDIGIEMKAEVVFNGESLEAVVTAISPEVVNNQVSGRLRFLEKNIKGLKQNQRLSARILLESKDNVLIVKRGPFLESGAGRIAYVVSDSMATKRQIQTGATSISEIEIVGGLEAGETIVISSLAAFEDADTILINQ